MTSLLDVNALLSLLDANHEHHAAITGWLHTHRDDSWASCPITQNGYVRIVTQDAYPNSLSIDIAVETLSNAVSTPTHVFLADDISILNRELFEHRHIRGNKQITDVYLYALAVSHNARFVTLDGGVPTQVARLASADSLQIVST